MTTDESPRSLVEQAAAWIPPWARSSPPAEEPVEAPAAPAAAVFDVVTAEPDGPPADEVGDTGGVPAEGSGVPPAGRDHGGLEVADIDPIPTGESTHADVNAAVVAEPVVAEPVAEPVDEQEDHGVGAVDEADFPVRQPNRDLDTPAPGPGVEPARELQLIPEAELRGALEAILLVVDEPVSEVLLAQVLEQPTERVTTVLASLTEDYSAADRGFELRRAAGGWRLYTRPRYAPYVEKFVLDGQQSRLTQAALETLAVVAYKQPVTRSRISAIRGVNCDGVVRTLVTRGLISECGSEPDSGAFLYRTTTLFLEKLGLDSITQLPALAPFLPDDVDEIADAQR